MRLIGYIRVSTEGQSESGLGLEAQIEALNNYATRHNLSLHEVFRDESISGAASLDERHGLMNAIGNLKKGDVLLVAKRDRLARHGHPLALIEMAVKGKKARIVSCAGEGTEGDEDDPSAFMMRSMADVFSQFERLQIKARTKAALAAKKRRGERVGHIPFGYKLAADGKHLEKCEEEQNILQQMRELRAEGLSVREIATALNEREQYNRGQARWHHMSVHRILKAA